ncbi:MAG: TonB-dependent receptor [Gammaproteobacteria bacterium]|nr:TonB-dependent receptor [Gammaproteobacteria bacterium]
MRVKSVAMLVAAVISQTALAQTSPTGGAEELEQVVVTGTRVANRSALDTAVPVDIVASEALTNIGVSELNQSLSVALPSFNFPRPGLADGTDTVRPAALRGLAPDQTLVLVNGKRRHSASLVNVNSTVGRGSAAVDLNTIPNSAVRAIEVLRDGASAQYGSDAIAGVINLRMREDRDGGELTLSYGGRDSEYNTLVGAAPAGATWSAPNVLKRSVNDGEIFTVGGWKGFAIGDSGFLTISAEYKEQERTERGGYDMRRQYPLLNPAVATSFDPREQTFNRFSQWYGEPEVQQATIFANAGIDLDESRSLYGWASYQDRSALSAGFQRLADDPNGRNVISIYPDGFLPKLQPDVTDYSLGFGSRWEMGEWDMDASVVYGYNEMMYTIVNTLNRSIGAASKTSFDAGGFDHEQTVFNVSGVRSLEVAGLASPLNLALGIEARQETYSITAGEPDSYRNGGVLLNGAPTASGAQVFPGFQPKNVVDESREAVGVYIDLEANITEQLLGSIAIRAEDYSDFGGNVSGKVAARYDFSDSLAIRTSYSTGFRAPSLQQQFFTTTSTNFVSGVPFDVTTFPATSSVATALGAKPLDSEDSTNVSVGLVFRLGEGASLTLDAYKIELENRIVLSENLTSAAVRTFLTNQGFVAIGGGRFFLNGVDTTTEGLDVVFNYPIKLESGGRVDFTATANFNDTEVTKVPTTAQLAALSPSPILFDRNNRLTFERGSPEDKFALSVSWTQGDFGVTGRATRYGDALQAQNVPTVTAPDFLMSAKTLVDLEARYTINERIKFAVGADNVFDEYPDPIPPGLNSTGAVAFPQLSPFGRSGRFVYGRVTFGF